MMKTIKYFLLAALVLCAGCADILETTDNRNVSDDDNQLNTTNDKMHSVVGVLKDMQAAIERYIIVGELRGELTNITSLTEGDLQTLADYTADSDNPYCSPQVFYSVINNANFFIARADTSVREIIDGVLQPVLLQDYVVMKTFRAWAYLQLGLMYGKASYFTEPLLTLESIEKYSKDPQYHYDLPTLLYALRDDLLATPDVDYPDYGEMGGHANFRDLCISKEMVLGEILLNLGPYDPTAYERACNYYVDAMARYKTGIRYKNAGMVYRALPGSSSNSAYGLRANYWRDKYCTNLSASYGDIFNGFAINEIMAGVQYSAANGGGVNLLSMTQVPVITNSVLTYQMAPSQAAMDLFKNEVYTYYDAVNTEFTYLQGDLRGNPGLSRTFLSWRQVDGSINQIVYGNGSYTYSASRSADSLPVISKYAAAFGVGSSGDIYITAYLYRRATVWLHFAEALNWSGRPSAAFAVLKYGLCNQVLNDPAKVNEREVTPMPSYLQVFTDSYYDDDIISGGMHSRGSGDTSNDTLHYVFNEVTLQDNLALNYYGFPEHLESLQDSILFVDAMICKELALETAFEGNRYTDLLRFAERRSQLYNDNKFLAEWLGRKNPALKTVLLSKDKWRLPLK